MPGMPPLEDRFQIDDRVLGDKVLPVGGHTPTLPFRITIGFAVEFKIAHTGAQVGIDMYNVAQAQAPRIGRGAIDAHNRHKAFGEQQFGKVECAVVVVNFDPLDAEGAEVRATTVRGCAPCRLPRRIRAPSGCRCQCRLPVADIRTVP